MHKRYRPRNGRSSFSDLFPTKLFSFPSVLLSVLGLIGLNGAFVFGYTLRMDLSVKSLLDTEFLGALALPFMIFSAGVSVFVAMMKISFIAGFEQGSREEGSSSANTFFYRIRRYASVPFSIFGAALIYCIIAFQFLAIKPALMFLAFSVSLVYFAVHFLRMGVGGEVMRSNGSYIESLKRYLNLSLSVTGCIENPKILKVNCTIVLVAAVGLGDARYMSLSSSLNYCISVDGDSMKVALIGQTDDYMLFSTKAGSAFGVFRRDPMIIVPKAELGPMGVDFCPNSKLPLNHA